MKFLCDKSRLENALSHLLLAIPSKESPRPSLKCVHLMADEDSLSLRGTNLELSMETRLDSVKVQTPGQGLVPARPLYSLLHEISDPTVEIEIDGGTLKLPTSTGEFEIVTSDPKDFPEFDFSSEDGGYELPIATLSQLFHSTEFACAREATKYAMNGVLISIGAGTVTMVATDGRRLAMNAAPVDIDETREMQTLLPQKSLAAVFRAMDDLSDEKVVIGVSENSVCFALPGRRMSIQRITGQFPDFEAVVPRDSTSSVELNKALFATNLRRTAILTEDMNPAVRITFKDGQATFESEAAGVGSANTSMDVDLSGPGGTITFNPHFLFDALKVAQHDPIRLDFHDGSSPGKFTLAEQFVYVVMPITGL